MGDINVTRLDAASSELEAFTCESNIYSIPASTWARLFWSILS
jgi:hypothetical protein